MPAYFIVNVFKTLAKHEAILNSLFVFVDVCYLIYPIESQTVF